MDFFIKGLIIGFSIAAPVGPIGLLCIQRTLIHGRVSGFVSGLGAATADSIYGSIAGFGLTIVSHFLIDQRMGIHLLGGVFLLLLGLKGLFAKPVASVARTSNPARGIGWHYLSTFLLTMTNPMTILSFLAVFAALGVGNSTHEYANATFTVIGVFVGSATWWWILSSSASWLKDKLHSATLQWIGRVSAVIIMGFGVFGIVSSGVISAYGHGEYFNSFLHIHVAAHLYNLI